MCQGYEAERASIIAGENYAYLRGFKAALLRKPQTSNPYNRQYEKYNFEAWNHGWSCFQKTNLILPFALILRYRNYCETILKKDWYGYGLGKFQKMEKQFKKTGKLPEALRKLL